MSTPEKKSRKSSLVDWLKPHRSAAITKLRNNSFALVVLFVATTLLPLTLSPVTCLYVLIRGGEWMSRPARIMCWIELSIIALLSINILQGYVGYKYPPPQYEAIDSPGNRSLPDGSPAKSRPLPFTPNASISRGPSFKTSIPPSPLSASTRATNYKSLFGASSSSYSPSQSSLSMSALSPSPLSASLAHRTRYVQSVRPLGSSFLTQLEATRDGN